VSPIGLDTGPNHNAEIVKRINVWTKEAGGDAGGELTRVAIKIDGKDYILEFRIVAGKGGPIVIPPEATPLKAALDLDAPTADVRQKGLTALSKGLDNLSSAILATPDDFPTLASIYVSFDKSLINQKSALSLTNTRKAIRAQLDARLKSIDINTKLNATTRQAVSDALKEVARALSTIS